VRYGAAKGPLRVVKIRISCYFNETDTKSKKTSTDPSQSFQVRDELLAGLLDAVVDSSLHRGQSLPPSPRLLRGLQSRLPRSRAQDAALPQSNNLNIYIAHFHSSWMVYRVRLRRGFISYAAETVLVPQDCRSRWRSLG